mgnify:FL=1
MKVLNNILNLILFLFLSLYGSDIVFASVTDGTIDTTYKYAWSQEVGWINFGATNGNVHITDSTLTGYIWSENYGWINVSPSQGGVANTSAGVLSGSAWGENLGWINFSGVTINSLGVFQGTASGDITGSINFDCANCSVRTDWRPQGARPACNNGSDDDGDGRIDYLADSGCSSLEDTDETPNVTGGGGGIPGTFGVVPTSPPQIQSPIHIITETFSFIPNVITNISQVVENIVPDFLKPKPVEAPLPELPKEITTKTAPKSMVGEWKLLPVRSINTFVFAPLPKEIIVLTEKFPELGETFKKLSITKMSDLEKLKTTRFVLPGLTREVGIAGGITVPLSSLSETQKKLLPSEIIFAKSGDLIDYSISLAITDDGKPEQRINTIAGKLLDLAIKVDEPVKKIRGYVTIKKLERQIGKRSVPASSLLGAPIVAALAVSYSPDEKIEVEKGLVLSEFEYLDENNDGIYTAKFQAPGVYGEYNIISIIEYRDISLGKKELRLIAVVDPEGYIYEANGNKETRIPNAKVSLLWKNPQTGVFELWPGKDYQQINPQKTDKSGAYSFLVPEGVYKLTVLSDEYENFEGQEFNVEEGRGVHENIELHPKSWWRSFFRFLKLI